MEIKKEATSLKSDFDNKLVIFETNSPIHVRELKPVINGIKEKVQKLKEKIDQFGILLSTFNSHLKKASDIYEATNKLM